jgi:hypothetical protein
MRPLRVVVCLTSLIGAVGASSVFAQEHPYFVTYDHYLEEPRNLEIAVSSTTGIPRPGRNVYTAPWLELEYGVRGWWTTEVYLEGVTTPHDGTGFSGWRWENRFRPLAGEHRVNPVLYVEYESINEASRIHKEIVGSGPLPSGPIDELRQTSAHELEAKLILSSLVGAWNVSENFIVEKNLSAAEGLEFGYSVGMSRSLGRLASGTSCRFCLENFTAGAEIYGGLGSTRQPALVRTRHYIAPVLAWRVSDRTALKISTGFGLTTNGDRYLLRLGWSYERPVGGR